MLPHPRFSTTRSGCDRQRRASSSTAEVRALPARRAEATDRGARTRTGKRGRRQAIKTELINKLLATTRHSHCTIHSNPVLIRCKYNNYITIQRSSHPIFYTSVNKNAACRLQDAKNMRSSRSTYYQMNVYPSILLKFLPFSPPFFLKETTKSISKSQVTVRKTHFVANRRSISSHLFTHASFLTPFLRPGRLKGTLPRLSPRRSPRVCPVSTAHGGCGERPLRSFSAFSLRSFQKASCFRRFAPHFRSYLRTTTK